MKTTTITYLLVVALILAGCNRPPEWTERIMPVSEKQQCLIAWQVREIMSATPKSLSGRDQNWDEAIEMAQRSAERTFCPPTYWERDESGYGFTGRWRYGHQDQSLLVSKPEIQK